MWEANGKATTLSLFLAILFPKNTDKYEMPPLETKQSGGKLLVHPWGVCLEDRRGKGSREIIGMLRVTSERTLDIDEEMCACFTGWQNVFHRVNWTELMQIMKGSNMNWRERRLISKLYVDQSARLWLARWKKTSVNIGRGFREGCLLEILFNL